ncbi:hypothetical protein [Streptomyces sp. NPDC000410]|uniref:SCO4225 family membrane protein n=1 Tax=Streptomyces sp. NPDC000410 TaxID=3154254 RepID=UPI003324FB9E
MNSSGHLSRIARLTFANPASLIYLALIAAAVLFATYDTLFVHHEDASFAWLAPMLLTAPTSFALVAGAPDADWFPYLALLLSALIQSFALGCFFQLLRRGPHSAHSHGV